MLIIVLTNSVCILSNHLIFSLSEKKLIKIPYENNHEEVYPNSLDTNFSSTKSNTNEVIEEEEELEENSSNEGSEEEEMEKQ